MRNKLALMLAAGLVAGAFGSVASAQRADSPKVTGGGQIEVSTNGGAGNTLTFVGIEDQQSGQVQYVPTSTGGGSAEGYWHGVVNCVEIEGNRARLSGTKFGSRGGTFWLEVIDNGPPTEGTGTDVIRLHEDSGTSCRAEEDDARESNLARGNAVVHNGE